MNTLFQPVRKADWVNQSIGLVGGVTAQSYQSLGLLRPGHEIMAPLFSSRGSDSPADATDLAAVSIGDFHLDIFHHLTGGSDNSNGGSVGAIDSTTAFDPDSQTASGTGAVGPVISSSPAESVFSSSLTDLSNAESLFQESVDSDLLSSASSSLFDLLQQTVDQTPAEQNSFADTFSGERQNALRAEIEEGGANVREFIADGIEERTGGRLQGEVNGLLESAGIQSDESLDVYAFGEQAVSDVVDAVVQPIGSVALPMVGPGLVAIREDFVGL